MTPRKALEKLINDAASQAMVKLQASSPPPEWYLQAAPPEPELQAAALTDEEVVAALAVAEWKVKEAEAEKAGDTMAESRHDNTAKKELDVARSSGEGTQVELAMEGGLQLVLEGGLKLTATQVRLLGLLFADCARAVVGPMHGGLSGSVVLTADTYNAVGQRKEPTIVKLDKQKDMEAEVEQTRHVHNLVGEGVIEIRRPPEYLEDDKGEGHGALLIEMAGACWVLPEFHGKMKGVELISTFKKKLLDCFARADDTAFGACLAVVKECWSPGGPLSKLSLATAERGTKAAAAEGGFLQEATREIVERLAILFVPPPGEAVSSNYLPPDELQKSIEALHLKPINKHAVKFGDSFVHDAPLAQHGLWSDQVCTPFVELLTTLTSSNLFTALVAWHPLCKYEHNDLNPANVLVDVRGMAWLIDFARRGLARDARHPPPWLSRSFVGQVQDNEPLHRHRTDALAAAAASAHHPSHCRRPPLCRQPVASGAREPAQGHARAQGGRNRGGGHAA